MRRHLLFVSFLAIGTTPLFAQQFVLQSGAIPGPLKWTEGLEAADIENDGDLDLFFADGQGFTGPGAKEQNRLVRNQLEVTANSFVDESITRLGTHTSHGKNVVTADIQGDGFIDALFCNAWDTDPPSLYVNNPANPGFFTFEGVARGFTDSYSSGGAQFGDLDDDGDLDVIIGDAYLASGFGKPHLFLNDGNGFFTEDAAFTAVAPNKQAMMDVQLVDMDGDFDLDLLGACRAENGSAATGDHFLMRNNGLGAFTNNSGAFPDGGSGAVYELEVADMDGDDDLDAFLVSLSGFSEGPIWNNSIGQSFSFATGSSLGGDDDNEVALYDYDMDGDYDAFIGSLGQREKVIRNNGGQSFTQLTTVIQTFGDSTLDITIADMDNDGAYDLITGQGESNSSQWVNKLYSNTGVVDTLAPKVVRVESIALDSVNGPWSFWAEARDQVIDDGRDWVSGQASYVVLDTLKNLNLSTTGGSLFGGAQTVEPGTLVSFTNNDSAAHSLVSSTADFPFDSGSLASGASIELMLVEPGVYTFIDGVGGLPASTIAVSAGPTQVANTLKQPGGLYRFEMSNGAGGAVRLTYELSFSDWAGNTTRVTGFADSEGLAPLGCGVNPNASLVHVSGYPNSGAMITVGLDNPLGTQSIGSIPILAFANFADPNTPCGTSLPGFGMSGGLGEFLVSLAAPFPVGPLLVGPLWTGAGNPAPITFAVPTDPAFIGRTIFSQGLLLDPSGAGPKFGLTNGLALTVFP